MKITIQAFGIAKDILGAASTTIDIETDATVANARKVLIKEFPEFEMLASMRLAVNAEYVDDAFNLSAADEIVLIPPVSGG